MRAAQTEAAVAAYLLLDPASRLFVQHRQHAQPYLHQQSLGTAASGAVWLQHASAPHNAAGVGRIAGQELPQTSMHRASAPHLTAEGAFVRVGSVPASVLVVNDVLTSGAHQICYNVYTPQLSSQSQVGP